MAVFVNVNCAVPALFPVTIPAFETDATAGLELTQVPPELGDNVVVAFLHIAVGPVMIATGMGFIATVVVGSEIQFVLAEVNLKVTVPTEILVTKPAFVTDATAGFELTQVPPVEGES